MSSDPGDYVFKKGKRDPKKIKIIEMEKRERFQREKDLNIMRYRAAQAPGITGTKCMTSELTEDDVVTIRKSLIKGMIFDLSEVLIAEAERTLGISQHGYIIKTVDRLNQILNEDIS